ncbi:MAG: hypothetical protein R2834_17330 [Rhodothermales bacterium]
MPKRERLRSDQLTDRARHLLTDRFGAGGDTHVGYAHSGFGLFAQHTCFVDGEAALLSLSQGTAVAVRVVDEGPSVMVGEGPGTRFDIEALEAGQLDAPLWARVVAAVWPMVREAGRHVQVAVIATGVPNVAEPYLASIAVATMRALLLARGREEGVELPFSALSAEISRLIRGPYSMAYLMAADAGSVDTIVMVNTLTRARRNIPIPGGDAICWGIVDVGSGAPRDEGAYRQFAHLAEEALQILKKGPYRDLRSLASLEFRELNRALGSLPKKLRPVVRFLVGETHRAHHLDTALKRSDWQVVGGLLFFSHAALRQEWAGTNEQVDYVVETVESLGGEGMYGACLSGRSGCVLVVGQRYAVPSCIERIKEGFMDRFGREPEAMLL